MDENRKRIELLVRCMGLDWIDCEGCGGVGEVEIMGETGPVECPLCLGVREYLVPKSELWAAKTTNPKSTLMAQIMVSDDSKKN